MCDIISIERSELPEVEIESRNLHRLIRKRAGDREELWFVQRERMSILPVWHDGQLKIYPWGSKYRSDRVPLGGQCVKRDLDLGSWSHLEPEPVEILATFACCNGFWYDVPQAIRGVLVRDARRRPRVYLLTTASTSYYRNLTRSSVEPVFVGPQI